MSNAVSLDACMFEDLTPDETIVIEGGNRGAAAEVFLGSVILTAGVVVTIAGTGTLNPAAVGGGLGAVSAGYSLIQNGISSSRR